MLPHIMVMIWNSDITLRSAPYPKRDLQRYWMSQRPWRRRAPSARPSWDSPHARPRALFKSMLPLIDEKSMSSMSVKHDRGAILHGRQVSGASRGSPVSS